MLLRIQFIILLAIAAPQVAHGSFVAYLGDAGFYQWQSEVDNFNGIDFGGFTTGTVITDQYADLGINLLTCCGISGTADPGGQTVAFIQASDEFSGGGRLVGWNGIRFQFDTPQHAVGVNFWGVVTFAFYLEGEFLGFAPAPIDDDSPFPPWFSTPGLGSFFVGLITEQPFDEVYLFKPSPPFSDNSKAIDDLYWGMPIPTPGVLSLLALAFLTGAPRRRR